MVELWELQKHFQVLSALPASTCAALLQQFPKVLEEPGAVDALQSVVSGAKVLLLTPCGFYTRLFLSVQLDQVLADETSLKDIISSESQTENVHVILELLERSAQGDQLIPVLEALQLIVSAMDGKKNGYWLE